jgi:hypothetical protein
MTTKELQKLGRRELLQLLLNQAKETERLSAELADAQTQLQELTDTYERLRERLNHKDERIHELESTLAEEREKREVDLEDVGSIAEAALKLHGVFDAAQEAADFYLQSLRQLYPLPEGVELPPGLESMARPAPASFQPKPETARPAPASFQPETEPLRSASAPFRLGPEFDLGPELDLDPEPVPEVKAERRPAERRERTGPGKRIAPPKKEKKKLTLFFGWQHD